MAVCFFFFCASQQDRVLYWAADMQLQLQAMYLAGCKASCHIITVRGCPHASSGYNSVIATLIQAGTAPETWADMWALM